MRINHNVKIEDKEYDGGDPRKYMTKAEISKQESIELFFLIAKAKGIGLHE